MSSHDENSPQQAALTYQSELVETPLPEILYATWRYQAPGAIECRRGNELKEIFIESGEIIFVTSNQVRDSLGDRLLRAGRITQEQYEQSVRLLLSTGMRQGSILEEMGVLAHEELFAAVTAQFQENLWSVFAWDAGTLRFTPGRPRHREFVKTHLPIPQAILQGVRSMPDPKMLLARVGAKSTVLVAAQSDGVDEYLGDEERRLLSQVDGKRTLAELVNAGPYPPGLHARILYALFVLKLVQVKAARPIRVQLRTDGGVYSAE